MIEFRQKIFVAPLIAGAGKLLASNGLMGATMVGGMVQSGNIAKQQSAQNEEMMEQQKRLQKQTQKALEKVAAAAQKDPSKAAQAAEVMQRYYSIPTITVKRLLAVGRNTVKRAPRRLKEYGQSVYEFGKALNNTGGGNQIAKKLGSGLAMGGTMAAGTYALDKAVQADRNRLTGGAPLPTPQKSNEQIAADKKKKIKKAVLGTAAVAGTVLAARRGYLGKGFQDLSKSGLKSITKADKSATINSLKEGMNFKNVAIGAGLAGLTTIPGYVVERKQLKDQAQAQQKQYAENYQYQNESQEKKRGSALKKLGVGALTTVGTLALVRRAGPAGLRRNINEMYMTYGKKIAGANGNKVGNWMMKSGAEHYGKAQAQITKRNLEGVIKTGKKATATLADPKALADASSKLKDPVKYEKYLNALRTKSGNISKAESALAKFNPETYAKTIGDARLKAIQSGKLRGRKIGDGILSGISKFWIGANGQQATGFLNKIAKDQTNSKKTREIANWLGKHKRAALVGSIGVGSIAFAPWGWGDKAVRGVTGAVDKNAFAYEKSKEQQI